jgi:hypothetical protein
MTQYIPERASNQSRQERTKPLINVHARRKSNSRNKDPTKARKSSKSKANQEPKVKARQAKATATARKAWRK